MKRAGLPLSVGSAPPALRLFIAIAFLAIGAACTGIGVFVAVSGPLAAAAVAALCVVPFGLLGLLAAAFAAAPFSRFGLWLDVFVATLVGGRLVAAIAGLWLIAIVVIAVAHTIR